MRCSSFRRSSFHSVMFLAQLKRLLMAALFALAGWWELKCKYLSVCVCFLKTVTLRVPSFLHVRLVSRKGREPSFSCSMVNLMVGHTSLRWRSEVSTASPCTCCIVQRDTMLFREIPAGFLSHPLVGMKCILRSMGIMCIYRASRANSDSGT